MPTVSSAVATSGILRSLRPVAASESPSPGCDVAPAEPAATLVAALSLTWPRGRAAAGAAACVAVPPPPPALDTDDVPSPLGKDPVGALMSLRLMLAQFRVPFKQLVTSHSMTEGLQAFQKSACIENWPPLASESRGLGTPRTFFQRTRKESTGRLTGWLTGQRSRVG